jgi:hypothetical protein
MKLNFYFWLLLTFSATILFSCKQSSDEPDVITEQHSNTTLQKADFDETSNLTMMNSYGAASSGKQSYRKFNYSKLAPPKQTFEISPVTWQKVTCAGGTKLTFDPGIFIYEETGELVKEPIQLEVTEYLSKADCILSGLNTMSNGQLIETAGMLYVDASAAGKPVIVKQGELYQIEFPATQNKPGMQLFYGEVINDTINWNSANSTLSNLQVDNRISTFKNRGVYMMLNQPLPRNEFKGGIKALYTYLHDNIEIPTGFEKVELKATSYVNFWLDEYGALHKVYTSPVKKTYADAQIVKAFELMPLWDTKVTKGEKLKMMLPIKMSFVQDPERIPAKMLAASNGKNTQFVAQYTEEAFVITAGKLGWINCDRFLTSGEVLTDVFVYTGDDNSPMAVNLVFDTINSIMPGTRIENGFLFQNLPLGIEYTVFAVKQLEDKFEFAYAQSVVTSDKKMSLTFLPKPKNEISVLINSICEGANNQNENLSLLSSK